MMLEKKSLNDRINELTLIVRKYVIQRFDKKNNRKRNEPKSCKLTVCYGQKNWR